jgi:hypothetical protein
MPKLKADPITESALSDYLSTGDDFGFEMVVLHNCLEKGFNAEHGGTYRDPITNKDRQFDIRLRHPKGLAVLKLAVECKNLGRNFPLLVSRVPRRAEESFHEIMRSRHTSLGSLIQGATNSDPADSLYACGQLVGKSTTQVGYTEKGDLTTGDSDVYEKWSQAVASSHDLVWEGPWQPSRSGNAAFSVVLPVLVVADGTLWTADYTADGQLIGKPQPCDECEFFLGKQVPPSLHPQPISYRISHLHLLTRTRFGGFLARIASNPKYWDMIFPPPLLKRLGGP